LFTSTERSYGELLLGLGAARKIHLEIFTGDRFLPQQPYLTLLTDTQMRKQKQHQARVLMESSLCYGRRKDSTSPLPETCSARQPRPRPGVAALPISDGESANRITQSVQLTLMLWWLLATQNDQETSTYKRFSYS